MVSAFRVHRATASVAACKLAVSYYDIVYYENGICNKH